MSSRMNAKIINCLLCLRTSDFATFERRSKKTTTTTTTTTKKLYHKSTIKKKKKSHYPFAFKSDATLIHSIDTDIHLI